MTWHISDLSLHVLVHLGSWQTKSTWHGTYQTSVFVSWYILAHDRIIAHDMPHISGLSLHVLVHLGSWQTKSTWHSIHQTSVFMSWYILAELFSTWRRKSSSDFCAWSACSFWAAAIWHSSSSLTLPTTHRRHRDSRKQMYPFCEVLQIHSLWLMLSGPIYLVVFVSVGCFLLCYILYIPEETMQHWAHSYNSTCLIIQILTTAQKVSKRTNHQPVLDIKIKKN